MTYDQVLRAMIDRYSETDEDVIVDFLAENMMFDPIDDSEFNRLCEDFEYELDSNEDCDE